MDQLDLIFWTALTGILSALATGLGAIPVGFVEHRTERWKAFSAAFAWPVIAIRNRPIVWCSCLESCSMVSFNVEPPAISTGETGMSVNA